MQVAGSAATTTPQTSAKSARQRQNEDGAALGAAVGLWSAPLGDFLQTLRAAWTKGSGAQRRGGAEQAVARTNTSTTAAHEKLLTDRAARDNAHDAQRNAAQTQDNQTREAHTELAAARHERSETTHSSAGSPRTPTMGGPGHHSADRAVQVNPGSDPDAGTLPQSSASPVPVDNVRAATHHAAAQTLLAQSANATRVANVALAPAAVPATAASAAKVLTTARPVEAISSTSGKAVNTNVGVATSRTGAAAATGATKTAATAPTASESDANIEQIVRWVRSRSDQRHSVTTLRLDPPELGKLTLRLELQGDMLQLEVEAATPAARRLLSEQTDVLRHSLEAAGIRLERVDVRLQETVADQPLADPQTQQQSLSNGHQPAGQQESPAQGGGMGGMEAPLASSTLVPTSLETTAPRMDALGVNVWA